MPTALRQTQVTHTPEVDHLLQVGRTRWPEASAGQLLVKLASERADQIAKEAVTDPLAGLVIFPATGRLITSSMVQQALEYE